MSWYVNDKEMVHNTISVWPLYAKYTSRDRRVYVCMGGMLFHVILVW